MDSFPSSGQVGSCKRQNTSYQILLLDISEFSQLAHINIVPCPMKKKKKKFKEEKKSEQLCQIISLAEISSKIIQTEK